MYINGLLSPIAGCIAIARPLQRRPSGCRFRGVTKHKRTQRYEAHIWESKKQIYLGGFDEESLAAKSHGRCHSTTYPRRSCAYIYDMMAVYNNSDIHTTTAHR